jgi:hypothetical protein
MGAKGPREEKGGVEQQDRPICSVACNYSSRFERKNGRRSAPSTGEIAIAIDTGEIAIAIDKVAGSLK